jgi:hypothetical protein
MGILLFCPSSILLDVHLILRVRVFPQVDGEDRRHEWEGVPTSRL